MYKKKIMQENCFCKNENIYHQCKYVSFAIFYLGNFIIYDIWTSWEFNVTIFSINGSPYWMHGDAQFLEWELNFEKKMFNVRKEEK